MVRVLCRAILLWLALVPVARAEVLVYAVTDESWAPYWIVDGERISGSAGCNRLSGSYKVEGRTLTAGPLMATKMACPGAGMMQESAFFALMRGPVTLSFPSDGTLEITGADGQTAVLKRAI
mgnify:CR=1 FL=1